MTSTSLAAACSLLLVVHALTPSSTAKAPRIYSDTNGDVVVATVPLPPEVAVESMQRWSLPGRPTHSLVLDCQGRLLDLPLGFATLAGARRRRTAGVIALAPETWVRSVFAGIEGAGLVSACDPNPRGCATVVIDRASLPSTQRVECDVRWAHGGGTVPAAAPWVVDLAGARVVYVDAVLFEAVQRVPPPGLPPQPPPLRAPPPSSPTAKARRAPGPFAPPPPGLLQSGLVDPTGPCHGAALALSRCVHETGTAGACRGEQRAYMQCQRRKLDEATGGDGSVAPEEQPEEGSDVSGDGDAAAGRGLPGGDTLGSGAARGAGSGSNPGASASVGSRSPGYAQEPPGGHAGSSMRFSATSAVAAAEARSQDQVAADAAAALGMDAAEVAAMCAALGDSDCPVRPAAAAALPTTGAGSFVPGGIGPFGFDISSMAGASPLAVRATSRTHTHAHPAPTGMVISAVVHGIVGPQIIQFVQAFLKKMMAQARASRCGTGPRAVPLVPRAPLPLADPARAQEGPRRRRRPSDVAARHERHARPLGSRGRGHGTGEFDNGGEGERSGAP